MKAILVIDKFPKSCYECRITHSETGFFGDICDSVCTVLDRTNIVFMDGMGKPDWCPLKPLPKNMEGLFELMCQQEQCEDTLGYKDEQNDKEWNRLFNKVKGKTE